MEKCTNCLHFLLNLYTLMNGDLPLSLLRVILDTLLFVDDFARVILDTLLIVDDFARVILDTLLFVDDFA
jgi:hypothetical protein